MALSSRSLQKLLRDHISGQEPLSLNPEEAQALATTLISRVGHLSGVEHNPNCFQDRNFSRRDDPNQPPPDTLCCCLLLQEAHENRWWSNETHLHLLNSADQQLRVKLSYERSAPISNLEEVVALIEAFRQRVNQQKAQLAKRQKQKDLKVQAILAQVRKMAKEDQFDFATDIDKVKLKLIIRLSDNDDYFAILIPFNKFKDVLPKLRTAIQALRETYNSGVRFTTHVSRGYRRSHWTRHQDL